MKKLLLGLLVSASLIACTNQETKPAFDLNNAKKEIEAANKEISDLLSKGDSVGAANMFSKDGKLMINNMPSITGKVNIASCWGGFTRMGGTLSLTTLEVWGDENFVTEEGVYLLNAKDGSQIDKGKYLVLWKRVDGKLMFYRDIFNSDLPLAK